MIDTIKPDCINYPPNLNRLRSMLIDLIKEGVMLVSQNLQPVYLNLKAREICQQLWHSDHHSNSLPPVISDICHRLTKNFSSEDRVFVMEYQVAEEQTIRIRACHFTLEVDDELSMAFGNCPWLLFFLEDRSASLQEELQIEQKKGKLLMIFKRFRKILLILLTVAVILTVIPSKVYAQQVDDLVFYEGNGCSQGIVFAYNSYRAADDNCKKRGPCKGDNDEARSLRIGKSVKQGAKIIVFDNPGGSTQDDYTTIDIVNRSFIQPEGYCLRSFEQTFDNPGANSGIRVEHFHQNGLDGKVSRVRVIPGS